MQPRKSYLICSTPRSGSYLLCEALTNTGLAGRPTEFFALGHEKLLLDYWQLTIKDYHHYLPKVLDLGTTPNGVFGAKLIWFTVDSFIAKLRTIPGYADMEMPKLLSTLFPDLQYIYITRRDKLRQAISYARALQTNEWLRKKDQAMLTAGEATFHLPTIHRLLQDLERDEQEMQQYFRQNGIEPFTVVYEELVTAYEKTAKDILCYLDIPFTEPLVFGERRIVKQADEITEEWIQRAQESYSPK